MNLHGRLQRAALAIGTLVVVAGLTTPAFAQGSGEATAREDVRYLTVGTHFFAPAQFTFLAGTHVRFVVTSVSRYHVHVILIVPADGTMIVGGQPQILHAGEHATIDWVPSEPGAYRLICVVCGLDEMVAYVLVT